MKEITTIKEVQDISFRILKYFASFCKKYNIPFMLAYGTLLGAVRHKGFIPWDDDIDVMLTRENYLKLIDAVKKEDVSPYEFLLPELDDDYFAPLGKIADTRTLVIQDYGYKSHKNSGLYVDIFVIDHIPSNECKARNFYNKANRLRFMWLMAMRALGKMSTSFLKYILRIPVSLFAKMFGWKYWRDRYINYAKSENESEYAGIVIYGEGLKKEMFPISMFESTTKVQFEGYEFDAPMNPDLYLTQMYGNYLVLPPVNERKKHPNKSYIL